MIEALIGAGVSEFSLEMTNQKKIVRPFFLCYRTLSSPKRSQSTQTKNVQVWICENIALRNSEETGDGFIT